jgi:Retroviral aspartyl protease.
VLVSSLAIEPVVTLKVDETDFEFIVDTGAAIYIVKPKIWRAPLVPRELAARGVTGNTLKILGTQTVKVSLVGKVFDHTFYVAKVQAAGDGNLGVDLLQLVGASVNLNVGCRRVGRHEALLKESSERIQLVQSDVKAHGENVG